MHFHLVSVLLHQDPNSKVCIFNTLNMKPWMHSSDLNRSPSILSSSFMCDSGLCNSHISVGKYRHKDMGKLVVFQDGWMKRNIGKAPRTLRKTWNMSEYWLWNLILFDCEYLNLGGLLPLAPSCLMLLNCVSKLSLYRTMEGLVVLCIKIEAELKI